MGWLENLKKQCVEVKKQIDAVTEDLENSKKDLSGNKGNKVLELEKTLRNYFLHITLSLYEIQGWQSFAHHKYKEAIDVFLAGIKNIREVFHEKIRKQKEFSLQIGLAKCYSIVKGYATDATKDAYLNIEAATSQNHKIAGSFFTLRGFLLHNIQSVNFDASFKFSKEIAAVAQTHQHPLLLIESHMLSGLQLFYMASWEEMQTHVDAAIAICKGDTKILHQCGFLEHPLLLLKAMESISLAYRGFPEQALKKVLSCLEFSQQINTPYNQVLAFIFTARVYQLQCNTTETIKHAAQAVKIAKEYNINFWRSVAEVILAWAIIQNKNNSDALALQENALLSLDEEKAVLYKPLLLSLLAESYQKMGFYDEALGAITESERYISENYQAAYKIEYLQTKGQILLNRSHEEAIVCFYEARKVASLHQMKFLEMRPLISLAKYTDGDEKAYLKKQLGELYFWFQEGFETTSLKEAKLLL